MPCVPDRASPSFEAVGAEQALYRTTQRIERELSDVAWATCRLGDAAQRNAVDLLFDLAGGDVREALARLARWTEVAADGVRSFGDSRSLALGWRRAQNNFEVYNLVKNRRAALPVDARGDVDLAAAIDQAYALGPYADLWAVEGLGHDYSAWQLARGATRGILIDGPAASLPSGSLTMMHAGLGLALAERMLPRLTPWATQQQFGSVLVDYSDACAAHGRPGFRRAAWESLGLVARTWHPRLVSGLGAACQVRDDGVAGFFWHGAGRALYFLPAYIVPVLSPWTAAQSEAPHELAQRNLIAGVAWAWTLVNIRHPAILAGLFEAIDGPLQADAVTNGIMSAMVVAIDTTPNDPYVVGVANHAPAATPATVTAWNAILRPAAEIVLNRLHPVLQESGVLDEVFHYVELNVLADRLERGARGSLVLPAPPIDPESDLERPVKPPPAWSAS
jgi:hypothetical protein